MTVVSQAAFCLQQPLRKNRCCPCLSDPTKIARTATSKTLRLTQGPFSVSRLLLLTFLVRAFSLLGRLGLCLRPLVCSQKSPSSINNVPPTKLNWPRAVFSDVFRRVGWGLLGPARQPTSLCTQSVRHARARARAWEKVGFRTEMVAKLHHVG